MAVPKAAVHENDQAAASKHQIGGPGQISHMQSIAEPPTVERPPYDHLWFRMFALYTTHESATCRADRQAIDW